MSITKTLITVVMSSLLITLSACSGVKPSLTAAPPQEQAFRSSLKKDISTINVPIEASTDDIARILNKTVQKELYKGSTKTKGLAADVLRSGPIVVSAADNYINFAIPITMSLSYSMFETPSIPLKLKFRASPKISPDWKLNADFQYMGISDLLAEEVGIGPLSIKPRSIFDGISQPVQKVVSDMISRKFNELFPLKNQVNTVWSAAHKPILVDKSYNAWLKLTPREVMLNPLYAQNNRVRLTVGINSFAEMVVGPEPQAAAASPLPNLKLVSNMDKNFRIALNADLFYKDIINIASPMLLNKEFDSDGRKITLTAFDLYGNGDNFVVKVETKGDLEGIFYLTGKPAFDAKTNVFSIRDVDFDMQTQSLLLNSADWFLHGTIKSKIQEKLNVDLTQRLEQSREMAQKAIAQVQLVDHVLLKGNIKKLSFNECLVQKDKISIQVYTEGESGVLFQ